RTTLHLLLFLSSGRRHTRSKRDWSSDVCSSDLAFSFVHSRLVTSARLRTTSTTASRPQAASTDHWPRGPASTALTAAPAMKATKIGRASCRDRVGIAVVAGSGGTIGQRDELRDD